MPDSGSFFQPRQTNKIIMGQASTYEEPPTKPLDQVLPLSGAALITEDEDETGDDDSFLENEDEEEIEPEDAD